MNFSEVVVDRGLPMLSTVTRFTEGLLQNNFDHLLGAGDALDDFPR